MRILFLPTSALIYLGSVAQTNHKQKHFKEYFLGFITISLGVTLGFIAEGLINLIPQDYGPG